MAKRKRTIGRTKLTPELQAELIDLIEAGNYIETAAEAVGISTRTWRRWEDQGLRGIEPFASLRLSCARARAKAEAHLARRVAAGDDKGVSFGPAKAAAWLLERTRPKRYALQVNHKIDEAVEDVLAAVREVCSPEDYAAVCEALERGNSGGRSPALASDPGVETGAIH